MVRKIAVILAGGVSLGTFEAGVMTELLYALDTLNRRADDTGEHFELDVMTGGSAGSLTSVLVAHSMYSDFARRRHELYEAWVEKIDIEALLEPQGAPANALFSRHLVRELTQLYIKGDNGQGGHGSQAASFAPERLALSFSLANMNGMDYSVSYASGPDPASGATTLPTTFFTDMARFTVERGTAPDWDAIAEAAIASGSFPIAFRPLELFRRKEDYPGADGVDDPTFFDLPMSFADGGTFNNEPVGEAIRRAAELDGDLPDRDRLFFLVDPRVNTSSRQRRIDPAESLIVHGLRLVGMVRGESVARDWLRAHRRNQELGWRDGLVEIVAPMFVSAELSDEEETARRLEEMARSLEALDSGVGKRPFALRRSLDHPAIEAARAQLSAAGASEARCKMFDDLVVVLNRIAGLAEKAEVNLHLIGSNAEQLAGDGLAGFGGFFDPTWREHDYRLGRGYAHERLRETLGDYPKELDAAGAPLREYVIEDEWAGLGKATLASTDRGGRKRFCNVAVERLKGTLRELGMNFWTALLVGGFARGLLRKVLELDE